MASVRRVSGCYRYFMDASVASLPTPRRAFDCGEVARLTGWRVPACLGVGLFLRLYYASLRFVCEPEDKEALRNALEGPSLIVLWHNRSLMVPPVFRKFLPVERVRCLISPSKQAAWQVRFFESVGLESIRGSSNRRSIQATREMMGALRQNCLVTLAPDGPKGPPYEVKRGVIKLAQLSGVPLLLMGADHERAWRPLTWDRHFVPLPGSRIRVRFRQLPPVSAWNVSPEEAPAYLKRALAGVTSDPDNLGLGSREN